MKAFLQSEGPYLVTPALPYVNGPIHLGTMFEHVQVNVFVRALKMAGAQVMCVCGADSHGTPIEINAQKAGMAPESFITLWQKKYAETFKQFGIEFDGGFGTTHTPTNERFAQQIFAKLKEAGHIATREIEQLYDPQANRFLPDRFVRGICPKCNAPDQYGDNCEKCGSTYQPVDLIEPRSAISGATPILKSSRHYFFELGHYQKALDNWAFTEGAVPAEMHGYLKHWMEEGLRDWDISRDGPYFGFKIPGEDNKYFYVWLDAPVGYISLTQIASQKKGVSADDIWRNPNAQIIHFIGKDIVYFHTLFWPAMLMASGYQLPKLIAVHGMLTVGGEKMSKSRGTFVLADDFAKLFEPESLRYYLASKMSSSVSDIDFDWQDFAARVNADMVNNAVNLISRTVPMLHKYCEGKIGAFDESASSLELQALAAQILPEIVQLYQQRETNRVTKLAMELAFAANRYLQENAPWVTVKTSPELAQKQLSTALWTGKVVLGLLKPIIPGLVEKLEAILNIAPITFHTVLDPLPDGSVIKPYARLFERIDLTKMNEPAKPTEVPVEKSPEINIDQFAAVELRAARVLEAKDVEGADKLISVQLDVGPLGKRHVFSGLKPHIQPAQLVGKMVVLVANLKPRKMKFGMSEGMILAAVQKDDVPHVISADGAQPGDRIS